MSMYPPDPNATRVGDQQRDKATDTINEAYVYGRITKAELDQRIGQVQQAATLGQLYQALEGIDPNIPTRTPYSPNPYAAQPPFSSPNPYGARPTYGAQVPHSMQTPYGAPGGYAPAYAAFPNYQPARSPLDRTIALLLAIFLGFIGVHRFYSGHIGVGILYFFTGGLFGIGWLIDIILIAVGSYSDSQGRPLK